MNLSEAKIGREYVVKNVNEKDEALKLRLIQLGIFPSAKISVLRFSPKKGTLLVNIFNTAFALKTNVANCVEIV